MIKDRKVDDDKAQGFNLGVAEALEAIREEIRKKHGVELDSRRDVVEIITRKTIVITLWCVVVGQAYMILLTVF